MANQDLESQEEFHFQYWLKPIEEKLTTTVTEFVYQFVKKFDFKHESKTEVFANKYLNDNTRAKTNILAYARFYSLYEWRLLTTNDAMEISNVLLHYTCVDVILILPNKQTLVCIMAFILDGRSE